MDFDRVAIQLTPGGTEYIVLETQLIQDFGKGQGPKGGVVTVNNGWVAVRGAGEARVEAGSQAPGGNFPPRLILVDDHGKNAVEISTYADPTGQPHMARVHLEGNSATLRFRDAAGNDHAFLDGGGGNLYLGGKADDGDVVLYAQGELDNRNASKATIHLNGGSGSIALRVSAGGSGAFVIKNIDGTEIIRLDSVFSPSIDPKELATVDSGRIILKDFKGRDSIVLHGGQGDIFLQNADCAEDFDLSEAAKAEPGTVVVIDEEGRLRPSMQPYDRKVAGVISGAGNCRPGLVLDKKDSGFERRPVSLVGKVYCKVDAQYAPIEVGDLLTTSATSGHAMKALDPSRAFGAVIGKALRALDRGSNLIPILIALQ